MENGQRFGQWVQAVAEEEIIMSKANRIRLFCILSALGCCLAYGGGYYFSSPNIEAPWVEPLAKQLQQLEAVPESTPSTAVLTPYQFVICEDDGYLIVYCADRETVYETTDIRFEDLPLKLRQEVQEGKLMYSEQELYNFLESYSS